MNSQRNLNEQIGALHFLGASLHVSSTKLLEQLSVCMGREPDETKVTAADKSALLLQVDSIEFFVKKLRERLGSQP